MRPIINWLAQQHRLLEQLEPYGTLLSFQRQNLIYTPEQLARKLYVLKAGQVSLQLIASSGRALTLQLVDMGHLFGHSMLAGCQHYDTFAEVTRTAQAVALSHDELQRALHDQPGLGLELLEVLGHYRLTVSRRLDEVAFKSVPARLASLLLEMADAAMSEQSSRLPRLPHRTHQQLAEMINAYRETVTKVINQFRAAQLLHIDRSGITLLNPSRLRELAQGS